MNDPAARYTGTAQLPSAATVPEPSTTLPGCATITTVSPGTPLPVKTQDPPPAS